MARAGVQRTRLDVLRTFFLLLLLHANGIYLERRQLVSYIPHGAFRVPHFRSPLRFPPADIRFK